MTDDMALQYMIGESDAFNRGYTEGFLGLSNTFDSAYSPNFFNSPSHEINLAPRSQWQTEPYD